MEGEPVNGEDVLLASDEVCRAGREMIGGRTVVEDGARGRDVSAERPGEWEMEGRLFCNRFAGCLFSGDPKVNAPDPPKLMRRSLEDEVERDQRFTPSMSSLLGGLRTSAEVIGRASEKSKPLYSGGGRLG